MAVEWKWLDKRPCRLQMMAESPGRIIALSDDQCAALMRAGVESADPVCWLFVAFGLNTAMRHSEILAARFDQIDFDKRRLFVPDAKAGHRAQPITPQLVEMLRSEREMRDVRDGWIFPSPHKDSGTGHRARMDNSFRDAVIRAGLDPAIVTPHVMRIQRLRPLSKLGLICRRFRTAAVTRPYRWCYATRMSMASTSIGPSRQSAERYPNFPRTDPAARLHRNYTEGPTES